MREAGISAIELRCLQQNHEVMWTFVQKPLSPCSLSWKLVLITENSARVLLTLLLQGKQNLLDWSSVCEMVIKIKIS